MSETPTPKQSNVVRGTITELFDDHAVITDEHRATWQIPHECLAPNAKTGDPVTLCVLAGNVQDREELARTLLNQLLG